MIKFRLYFDKDAETKWLNEMSMQGFAMKRFFAGFYTFEKCEPGQYIYQVDFADTFFKVSDDYKELMNDMGVTIVQSWGYWVILRKAASEGTFELYTDVESKIEHYTKIRKMFKIVTIIELICFFVEVMAATAGDVGFAVPGACLILAIIVVCINAVAKTTDIINQLKEQQTGIEVEKKRNISMLLCVGLLLNSCALIIQDSVSDYLKLTIQIIAIAFMLAGLWSTCRTKNK